MYHEFDFTRSIGVAALKNIKVFICVNGVSVIIPYVF